MVLCRHTHIKCFSSVYELHTAYQIWPHECKYLMHFNTCLNWIFSYVSHFVLHKMTKIKILHTQIISCIGYIKSYGGHLVSQRMTKFNSIWNFVGLKGLSLFEVNQIWCIKDIELTSYIIHSIYQSQNFFKSMRILACT